MEKQKKDLLYFDVMQMNDVRDQIEKILKEQSEKQNYHFDLPRILYKYCKFADYTISGLEKCTITFTPIELLNDMFDSSINIVADEREIEADIDSFFTRLHNLKLGCYVNHYVNHCKNSIVEGYKKSINRKYKDLFDLLPYLGARVACLTNINNSPLMWSHYANSNQGLCIAYDFGKLERNSKISKMIFPVLYSDKPIDLHKYFDDKNNNDYNFKIEIAITIAVLSKAIYWNYENEWRIIDISKNDDEKGKHISLDIGVKPCGVYMGYHFFKNFIINENDDTYEKQYNRLKDSLALTDRIFNLCESNSIPLYAIDYEFGTYNLIPKRMSAKKLRYFFKSEIIRPVEYRFYHSLHDSFLRCFDT